MGKSLFISRQSGHPTGWFGHLVAFVMSRETTSINDLALENLALEPTDRVLEIGCGHGKTLSSVAEQEQGVTLTGVDPSAVMLRVARRNHEWGEGSVSLRGGEQEVGCHGHPDASGGTRGTVRGGGAPEDTFGNGPSF